MAVYKGTNIIPGQVLNDDHIGDASTSATKRFLTGTSSATNCAGSDYISPNATVDGTGLITGSILRTSNGIVNFNDKAKIQYNSTDNSIDFIFS